MLGLSRALVLLLSSTLVGARMDAGHPSPGCHDATIAWLRLQARSDDPETRRSARYLLRVHGYTVLGDAVPAPIPRRRDAPPRAPARRRRREDTLPRTTRLQGGGTAMSSGAAAVNDGPALRAALRPAAGTQQEWLQALGWPTDAHANPCDEDDFVWPGCGIDSGGCKCDKGRVTSVDLRHNSTLSSYTLQPPVANLTKLQTLCAAPPTLTWLRPLCCYAGLGWLSLARARV
jgi:hypothetical protein